LLLGDRLSKNLFDGRLVLAQELSDDCVASLSLEIRAEQKTPARMLLLGFRAQPEEQPRKSVTRFARRGILDYIVRNP